MGPRDPPTSESLTESSSRSSSAITELRATFSMGLHCFDALVSTLNASVAGRLELPTVSKGKTKLSFSESLPPGESHCPLFVTWEKKKKKKMSASASASVLSKSMEKRYELRGCIGTHGPKPLTTSLAEYAILAAMKDRRFNPITLNELQMLRVTVSLLIRYETCEHCRDWTVGVHGLIIGWISEGENEREYSATYLPEVAQEQDWNQIEAVESLIRKAGYHGPITPSLLEKLCCSRYQTSRVSVLFDEYIQERGGMDLWKTVMRIHGSQEHRQELNLLSSGTHCIVS